MLVWLAGRGKQIKQAKVVATCSPRIVQEVKPEIVKTEEPETVYEETVYQDLTFEEEIYQDSNNEAGTSANEPTIGWHFFIIFLFIYICICGVQGVSKSEQRNLIILHYSE